MARRGRKNISFTTRRQSSSGEMKKFAFILVSCVLSILVISCLAILKKYNFDVKSALGGNAETEVSEETTSVQPVEIEADKSYLFWCADDEEGFYFAWLVNIKLPERTATVMTLETDMKIPALPESEETESIKSIYLRSGINELVSRLESSLELEIEGHIGSDPEAFKSMINYFGGMDITVPEQIEYKSNEFSVILVKGKQNIKGDSLFKYLRYLGTLGENGRRLQASAVIEMLEYVFKPAYTKKSSNVFSRLSNTLETDLTIVDFSSSKKGIDVLTENGLYAGKIAKSVDDFKED